MVFRLNGSPITQSNLLQLGHPTDDQRVDPLQNVLHLSSLCSASAAAAGLMIKAAALPSPQKVTR